MAISLQAFKNRLEKIGKIAQKRQVNLLVYVDERQLLSFSEIRTDCRVKPRKFMLGIVDTKGNYREFS